MMVPGEMLIIQNYQTVSAFGWIDTYPRVNYSLYCKCLAYLPIKTIFHANSGTAI